MERRARGGSRHACASFDDDDDFGLYGIPAFRTDHIKSHVVDGDLRRGNRRGTRDGAACGTFYAVRRVIEIVYPYRVRCIAVRLERKHRSTFRAVICPACIAYTSRRTVVRITHAHGARHAVQCNVQVVHDRLERLRFSVCIHEREKRAD